jgi:hypothetical protein
MSAKHTKGPWSVRCNYFSRWEILYSGGVLAGISKHDDPASPPPVNETEANARLIAAAPELLEALTEVIADLQFSEVEQHANLVTMARAALAKATGESNA